MAPLPLPPLAASCFTRATPSPCASSAGERPGAAQDLEGPLLLHVARGQAAGPGEPAMGPRASKCLLAGAAGARRGNAGRRALLSGPGESAPCELADGPRMLRAFRGGFPPFFRRAGRARPPHGGPRREAAPPPNARAPLFRCLPRHAEVRQYFSLLRGAGLRAVLTASWGCWRPPPGPCSSRGFTAAPFARVYSNAMQARVVADRQTEAGEGAPDPLPPLNFCLSYHGGPLWPDIDRLLTPLSPIFAPLAFFIRHRRRQFMSLTRYLLTDTLSALASAGWPEEGVVAFRDSLGQRALLVRRFSRLPGWRH